MNIAMIIIGFILMCIAAYGSVRFQIGGELNGAFLIDILVGGVLLIMGVIM